MANVFGVGGKTFHDPSTCLKKTIDEEFPVATAPIRT
jgi:hypothetical protein